MNPDFHNHLNWERTQKRQITRGKNWKGRETFAKPRKKIRNTNRPTKRRQNDEVENKRGQNNQPTNLEVGPQTRGGDVDDGISMNPSDRQKGLDGSLILLYGLA